MPSKSIPAPRAAREPVILETSGHQRRDDYAWLKDLHWQDVMRDPEQLDPRIREYLEAENQYTEAALSDTLSLQATLVKEMRARIKEDDSSVPARDGAFEYYVRYRQGGQHPLVCRKSISSEAEEEILLDCDARSSAHNYFHLGDYGHSTDHSIFAWSEDIAGSEIHHIRFKDLATDQILSNEVARASGSFEWAGDNRTVFYTQLDDNHRPCRVYAHTLGDNAQADTLVYEESDAGFFVGVELSESRRFIVISTHDHVTGEVRLIEARAPYSSQQLVAVRETGVEYSVSHRGDELYILTNADDSEDFKIVRTPITSTHRDSWEDVIPHRPGTLIVAMQMFAHFLVRLERVDSLPRIVVRALDTGEEHVIAFDESAYSLALQGGYEFDTTWLRFSYSSMTTPEQVFDYDMATRERVLRKTQEVPSGHDARHYCTQRLFATAHDGERIPISLLRRADIPLDGTAPVLLYGYGAYGISIPASFSTARLSLVDRGFIYCIAHVRGGMERGYRWYREGKLEHKRNTFEDFASVAQYLIDQRITAQGNIAAQGASAGGMLMGVIANTHAELFKAVVAEVPFVDVLNTMCDADLPLTPPEWPEWGNPITDPQAYELIASYSPYDNVHHGEYPHMLVTAGLSDPRVTYWEPAKWVARLREMKSGDHLLLLKTHMSAGHAGAAGRLERLEETALTYAFLLKVFQRM